MVLTDRDGRERADFSTIPWADGVGIQLSSIDNSQSPGIYASVLEDPRDKALHASLGVTGVKTEQFHIWGLPAGLEVEMTDRNGKSHLHLPAARKE
jgi:hypothetical protein